MLDFGLACICHSFEAHFLCQLSTVESSFVEVVGFAEAKGRQISGQLGRCLGIDLGLEATVVGREWISACS